MKIIRNILAVVLGAFAGGVLVWLHYLPHWGVTTDPNAKLGVFCTAPAMRNTASNLLSEVIGTFVLVLVAAAIFSRRVSISGIAPGLGPFLVGGLVWGIGLSLGGPTGSAINPARDLGPRLAHAVLPIPGKRDADWGFAAVPVVGPLVGADFAGVVAMVARF